MIQDGKVPLVEKQSNRVTVWAIPVLSPFHEDCETPDRIHAVYDNKRKSIVTVLFEDGPKI